jgi:8-oxo-dGTP pyrophosphatase MutT (NUDIX family)
MRMDHLAKRLAHLGREHGQPDGAPRAAVAAILRASPAAGAEAEAELFFIRRAEHPSDPWSGHIAFPGGRLEPSDPTLLAAAIRETREEVGIELSEAELVARLPDVPAFTRSKRSQLVVTPFVFVVRSGHEVTPNHEVAETLWFPFGKLARGEGRGTHPWTYEGKRYELPCIRLEPPSNVLWGLTYRMCETMLDALAANAGG